MAEQQVNVAQFNGGQFNGAQFNVVAEGRLVDGFGVEQVLLQLEQQLKLPAAKAQQLLAGKPVVVKRALAEDTAQTYCNRLLALGVQARIEAIAPQITAAETAPPIVETTPPTAARVAPDHVAAREIFPRITTALRGAGNSLQYTRQLLLATARIVGIASAYMAVTLMACALYGYYAVHFFRLLTAPPILFSATIYLIPLFAFTLLLVFLLRPFFPARAPSKIPLPLNPLQQPELFDAVAQLCAAVAVPTPNMIALTVDTAHSVEIERGTKHFFRGEYQLTIGLPLLEATTLRDGAGLIARELGCHAKPTALRCYRAMQLIEARFLHCCAGRDWLSTKISTLATDDPQQRPKLLFLTLHFLLKQSNIFLQRFAQALKTTQHSLQAQALLEGDRYQTLLAGTASLEQTLIAQHKLNVAFAHAQAKNNEDRLDGGLVDDLPALIRHYYDSSDAKLDTELRKQWQQAVVVRGVALPSVQERVERIRKHAETALAVDDVSAGTLLRQRAELSKQVTLCNYREQSLIFDEATLLPVDDLMYAATQDILRRQQASVYFNNWFRPFRFWRVADYQLIREMPLNDAAQQLSVCVNEIRRLSPDRMKLLAEYERLQNQIQEILIGQQVLAARQPFQFRYFQYDGSTLQPLLEERQQQIAKVMEQLAVQETIMGGRITLGLHLSGQAEEDVVDLHRALTLLHPLENRLYKLALDIYLLQQLLQRARSADYKIAIAKVEEKIKDSSIVLLERLKDIPYPFDRRYSSLKAFVETALEKSLRGDDRSNVLTRAQRLLALVQSCNEKFTYQAAEYGTTAEEAYKIEPIKLIAAD